MSIILNGTTGITTPAIDSEARFASADMPAGSVLQVVAVQSTTQVAITTSGPQSIGLSTSMTVSANSKVIMSSAVPFFNDGSASTWTNAGTSTLYLDGSQVAYSEHVGTTTGEAAAWTNSFQFLVGPLSAGTHTFEVKHGRTIGGTHVMMRDGRAGSLILTEVAG
tara:strand:- start:1200 stop:1694 length:495 start_codon:yes stop_codon:yes gene_type:complete